MNVDQAVKFYEAQTAALNVIVRMEEAMSRVVDRMETLLKSTQKTTAQANKMKAPFDSIAKSIGSQGEKGLDNLKSYFNPKNILADKKPNMFLPLAISIGWELFGDDIMTLLGPAMGALQSFAGFVHNALVALNPLFQPVVFGLEMISAGLGVMAQNAALFLPAVAVVALRVGVLQKAAWFTKLAAIATTAYQMAMGILSMVVGVFSGNIALAKAGMLGMNAAMMANPAAAMAGGILLVVGVIAAAVALFNRLNGTAVSVAGVIGAAFAVLGAFLMNFVVIPVWNLFAALANFLGNLFRDPVAAITILFYNLLMTVSQWLIGIVSAIEGLANLIPGVQLDLTSSMKAEYEQMEKEVQGIKDESGWKEFVQTRESIDYGQAAMAGYSMGESLWSKAGSLFGGATEEAPNVGTVETVKNVGGEVNIADEDLKFLRDVAEMRYIQNFVTLTPTVAMNASISERVDVGTVVTAIERKLEEEFAANAEGVYA